jgi:hypothetical protein
MDRVGLPAYGPDLIDSGGRWDLIEDTMAALPSPLRAIWLEAGLRPVSGGAAMNIDRRRVSVETKRLLERVPGLQFRQGFVVDLRVLPPVPEGGPSRVQVETIFGEVFEADAVVVAAGLSLGGRSSVGGDTVEGGRYGEPASNGLLGALEALGAEFREVGLEVGSRAAASDFCVLGAAALREAALKDASSFDAAPSDSALERKSLRASIDSDSAVAESQLVAVSEDEDAWAWPADYPPAPHRDPALRLRKMLVAVQKIEGGKEPLSAGCLPVISPDGAATCEIYVTPDSIAADAVQGGPGRVSTAVTRPAMTVTASVLTNLSQSGRLAAPAAHGRIWVVGRSAGAEDYLESLASGVRGGLDVAATLGGDGDSA